MIRLISSTNTIPNLAEFLSTLICTVSQKQVSASSNAFKNSTEMIRCLIVATYVELIAVTATMRSRIIQLLCLL